MRTSQGLYASRRIAKACEERVDVMAVTARQSPDFRTISDFRKRHLPALGGLFTQVLQLCQKAGLVSSWATWHWMGRRSEPTPRSIRR
jgi:transposase